MSHLRILLMKYQHIICWLVRLERCNRGGIYSGYTIKEYNQTEQSITIERTWTSEDIYLKFNEYYNMAFPESDILIDLSELIETTLTL